MFELTQLELLCAVGRTGSYSAAARELRMTQPAVTYQMQRLERSLGAPLAVRIGRTMRLTSVGMVVREHAERVLAEVSAAERQISTAIGTNTATVRLAAFPSSCATVVPAALARLRVSHPNLTVQVTQGEAPAIHDQVTIGDADVGITYSFAPRADRQRDAEQEGRLYRVPLDIDDIRLLLPAQHRSAAHSLVEPDEVVEETFLLGSQRFVRMLTDLYQPLGRTPPMMVVADDYVTMQAWVAYEHGVALVPDLALRAHRDERVVARTFAGWPSRHIALVMWPDQRKVPAVNAVIDALRAALHQAVPARLPRRRTESSGQRREVGVIE